MSYCRWSSDDFQCDVYVYADTSGGWTTHVAGRRRVYHDPLPEPAAFVPGDDASFTGWFERNRKVAHWPHHMVDIGGSHDGETIRDATAGDCADTLEMLRDAGYRVPQEAIDELRKEATGDSAA